MSGFSKILVPVDFSEGSQVVLRKAAFMAEKLEDRLYVTFVFATVPSLYDLSVLHLSSDVLREEDLIHEHGLEKKLEEFINENLDLSVAFNSKVLSGSVAEEIIRFAEDEGIGLIIMGTHGHRGFERMLLGSVANKVLRMAPCPVLTINTFNSGEGEHPAL